MVSSFLEHDNIQPFLGTDERTFVGFLCLVSPWQYNGNALECRKLLTRLDLPLLIDEWVRHRICDHRHGDLQ